MRDVSAGYKLHFTLRIAVAMCFIGHGAFGIITKPVWCNYFAVFGIDKPLAYTLMPIVGIADILLGVLMLLYPVRAIAWWLVGWGVVTALLRPLSGEPFPEFIERAGNYGAPLALLILSGNMFKRGWLFKKITPVTSLQEDVCKRLVTCLKYVVFLLLLGHGWLNLLPKKALIDQYSALGFTNPVTTAHLVGSAEILAAVSVLVKPYRPLLLLFFAWKMMSETPYPHYAIFEWIERGGSYGAILALWLALPGARSTIKTGFLKTAGAGRVALLVLMICFLASCKDKHAYEKQMHNPFLYSKTVKKLNDIVLENNFPPMVASRNYAYANIAAYEVIAAGDDRYRSLSGQIRHLPPMPKPGKDIDFPFAAMLAFCKVGNAVTFPEGSMDTYVQALKDTAEEAGMPSAIFEASVAYGNKVADSILAWSKKDNYAQTRSAPKYTVTNDSGRWVPTPPMYSQAIEPHWMEIRTLVLDSASQFKPIRPPKFEPLNKSSEFYKAVMLVKNRVDSLTPEQKHMADFWDDNPFKLNVSGHVMYGTKKFSPGGHWMNIAGILARKKNTDFSETVSVYALASIALFDAFISCWDEKYRSNYIRPETAINKYYDPEWRPYLQTPPFPEYSSGHAVISAAAAEVIASQLGDNIAYKDTSETEFGIAPRSFTSIKAAAKEAAESRVYGGIHFKSACDIGNVKGQLIGQFILQRLQMKKH